MNLIVCGDSWSNGAELHDYELTFGDILAKKLSANLYNQSVDASSIPHLVLQLRQAINQVDLTQPTKALFFLTSKDRDVIWSQHFSKGTGFLMTHPLPYLKPEEIFLNPNDPLHEHWYKLYHTNELANFRCNTSLITLQAICNHYNIRDYYLWGWESFDLWPEINQTKFYNITAFEMFTNDSTVTPSPAFNKNCKYIWPNGGHPNQLGHELIAHTLYPWMSDVHRI